MNKEEALEFFLSELWEAAHEAVQKDHANNCFEIPDERFKVERKFENSLSYLAYFAARNAES